jgi:hypothetical protein
MAIRLLRNVRLKYKKMKRPVELKTADPLPTPEFEVNLI